MKSLFSCIPRKKPKTKKSSSHLIGENCHANNKPLDSNNLNAESHIEKQVAIPIEQTNHIDKITEHSHQEIENAKEKQIEEQKIEALMKRLNNAMLRIENVSNVLNNKFVGYCLPEVINQFDSLCSKELQHFILVSENLDSSIETQTNFIKQLFVIQKLFLVMINKQFFDDLPNIVDDFRAIVVKINELCIEDDENVRDLHRLIADSIIIFGWICISERPASFLQNNLDGFFISITRLLNDNRLAPYVTWLKSWAVVLKRFCAIVTVNFQAALMWGLDGPVPTDILHCLIECNYSRFEDRRAQLNGKHKEKVIKTTTVNDMTCEAMTNLMDDLRNGNQKSRLRPVRTDGGTEVQVAIVDPSETSFDDGGNIRFRSRDNAWIIENIRNQPDIELPSKQSGNAILINNCHDCSIQIEGVLGSVKIVDSSNLNLVLDDVTGLFQIMNSTDVQCQLFCNVRKVDLKNVSNFKLFIPLRCANELEITSSTSSNIELFVSKTEEGGLELDDYNQLSIQTSCRTKLTGSGLRNELF